ncbi:MAG: hypothetical protein Kow00127_05190 [Bacteroidales bacterium]
MHSQFLSSIAFIIFFVPTAVSAGKKPVVNPGVKYRVTEENNQIIIHYLFPVETSVFAKITLLFGKEKTETDIRRFGIPDSLFEPYVVSEREMKRRDRIIEQGLFRRDGKFIIPDRQAILNVYGESWCKPVARALSSLADSLGITGREQLILLAARFVQNIPYGTVESYKKGIHTGGFAPPPLLLSNGYGDCDSKAVLFAGIIRYLLPGEEVWYLNLPNHTLCAIKGNPEKGDRWLRINGEIFLPLEVSGPGNANPGETGQRRIRQVETEPAW